LLKEALQEVKKQNPDCQDDNLADLLEQFINEIEDDGFIPKNLFFANLRFHRWLELNRSAEITAQARTINELYDTYQLHLLEERYPETRARFFLETVFSNSSPELRERLKHIVLQQHRQKFSAEHSLGLYSNIAEEVELNDQEQYFLSRLSYPHLKPTDSAQFVADHSEGATPDVVVRFEDDDGVPFWIRKPATPREISRLHALFLDNNLPVVFRPEHRFLIVVSERGHVVAGLFYSYTDDKTAYLEKIVVSPRFRRKGMSERLMQEFFSRLQGERIQQVTTGFFRPEYFYRFGFRIERKYAGLVRELQNK
jgi:long-chain acyl-CoA synthetase